MPLWWWIVDSLALLVGLGVLLVVGLLVRRRVLARSGGTRSTRSTRGTWWWPSRTPLTCSSSP